MAAPQVSVVIPSSGRRATLVEAVRSARSQQGVRVEVLVVLDAPRGTPVDPEVRVLADGVLATGGGRGAATARNLGTRVASAPWVAYLDDDDVWLPTKLRAQLAVARAAEVAGRRVLVSSQVHLMWDDEVGGGPVPRTVIGYGEPVEAYLFRGRGLEPDRHALFTSTLLVDRDTALRVPWDERLPRHQDWDWTVRLSRDPGLDVVQLSEVLGLQRVGSPRSISAGCDWRTTLRWGRSMRAGWERRTYADFLAGQLLRYALQARSVRGTAYAVTELLASGRPSWRSLALGLSGAVPRHHVQAVARLVSARRRAEAVEPMAAPRTEELATVGREAA